MIRPARPRRSLRRRLLLGLGAAAVLSAAALAYRAPPHRLLDAVAALMPGCLFYVDTDAPAVALTIDDGPDPATTPDLLRLLSRHDARATFFLISDRAAGRESLVGAMAAAGHELGNHLTRDRPSIALAPEEFEAELLAAHAVLSRHARPAWVRPGSGWYTPRMVGTMRRHGYRCALGSVYPFDALVPSSDFAAGYLLRNARPGSIIVLHDGGARGRRTHRTLARVLPVLRERGLRVVTLSELAGGPSAD